MPLLNGARDDRHRQRLSRGPLLNSRRGVSVLLDAHGIGMVPLNLTVGALHHQQLPQWLCTPKVSLPSRAQRQARTSTPTISHGMTFPWRHHRFRHEFDWTGNATLSPLPLPATIEHVGGHRGLASHHATQPRPRHSVATSSAMPGFTPRPDEMWPGHTLLPLGRTRRRWCTNETHFMSR